MFGTDSKRTSEYRPSLRHTCALVHGSAILPIHVALATAQNDGLVVYAANTNLSSKQVRLCTFLYRNKSVEFHGWVTVSALQTGHFCHVL